MTITQCKVAVFRTGEDAMATVIAEASSAGPAMHKLCFIANIHPGALSAPVSCVTRLDSCPGHGLAR